MGPRLSYLSLLPRVLAMCPWSTGQYVLGNAEKTSQCVKLVWAELPHLRTTCVGALWAESPHITALMASRAGNKTSWHLGHISRQSLRCTDLSLCDLCKYSSHVGGLSVQAITIHATWSSSQMHPSRGSPALSNGNAKL